uniref:Flagellar basal-body/hook protein C-terminal domain-containing protein n=1 Tax=Caulobacter sp. (strain K31) TaxID=366602 RepID=B0SYM5_CAUSK
MQVLAAADRFSAQRTATSAAQPQAAPPVDLTSLAVAQDVANMALSASAAIGQTAGELTGVLLNITA